MEPLYKVPKSHSNNTFLDLREEDNLSIVDETAGPNVSFIGRFPHCTSAGVESIISLLVVAS